MHATENKVYVLPFAAREFYISVVYSLDLDTGEWARELEDYTLLSEVWTNIENRVWIEFVSAVPDGKMMNVDILTEEWTEGQNIPAVSVNRNQTGLLWLGLLIIPGALLIYFIRKPMKRQG
jgi:hypothetical protein